MKAGTLWFEITASDIRLAQRNGRHGIRAGRVTSEGTSEFLKANFEMSGKSLIFRVEGAANPVHLGRKSSQPHLVAAALVSDYGKLNGEIPHVQYKDWL